MTGVRPSLPPVFLGQDRLQEVEALVAATIPDPEQRLIIGQRLLARAGLIEVLDSQAPDLLGALDLDTRGGFAGRDSTGNLGIVDLWANGHLIGIYATVPGVDMIWLTPAQVQAQAAPDLWAVLVLSSVSDTDGLWVTLGGWLPTAIVRDGTPDADGLYAIPLAALQSSSTLYPHLSTPSAVPRQARVHPRADLQQALAADPRPFLQPLAMMDPDVFDCLVAAPALARIYLHALAEAPSMRATLTAPAAWALPEAPAPSEAAAEAALLTERVLSLARRGHLSAALRLLKTAQTPELLRLRAAVYSLTGHLTAAIADVRAAYRLAPDRAQGLFTLRLTPQPAFAWQYATRAGLAAGEMIVVDATAPDREPLAAKEPARLRVEKRHRFLSLALDLPAAYAGYSYRVFIVSAELRRQLGLQDPLIFRRAFTYRPNAPVAEQENTLSELVMVLTEDGAVVEGQVAEDGAISVFEPIWLVGAGADYLADKTVVVVLFRPEGNHVAA